MTGQALTLSPQAARRRAALHALEVLDRTVGMLRQEIDARGVSQAQAAREMGYCEQQVSRWLIGRAAPSREGVVDILTWITLTPTPTPTPLEPLA